MSHAFCGRKVIDYLDGQSRSLTLSFFVMLRLYIVQGKSIKGPRQTDSSNSSGAAQVITILSGYVKMFTSRRHRLVTPRADPQLPSRLDQGAK